MNKLVFASVISEIQQSDIFMTVKARICEAPAANLNGARVTEAFINEIVDNPDRYVGLPLYADVKALTSGNYRRLGHLYDSRTGEFHSTQIGSFYQFEKEEFENGEEKGCYLVGYARIAKRNRKLSKAISELFADGALKFSFEVAVGEYEELEDDTILIDASENNYLEGTAIVTFPACEDAVALELVAQRKADDTERGEEGMADTKVTVEETVEIAAEKAAEVTAEEAVEEVTAESVETEPVETAETKTAEAETAEAETPEAETQTAEQENAAVVVHERTEETHSTCAYDTESGVEVCQRVEVETCVSHVEPDAHIVEADDGLHIAEAEESEPEKSGELGEVTEPDKDDPTKDDDEGSSDDPEPAADVPNTDETKKKTAEQMIAELAEVVETLRKEISELKEMKVTASTANVVGEVNPMMEDIHCTGKYSLLEKEEKISGYTLLSR